MNQSLSYSIGAVMPAVLASGLLVSLCTITEPSGEFEDSGAPDSSVPYVSVSGMVDIPCTAPPEMTSDSVRPSEIKSQTEILAINQFHVLLGGYYSPINAGYNRALVDGIEYDVTNVESDSQHQMTRLAMQKVTI